MAQACSDTVCTDTGHRSRAGAVLRRIGAYTGVTLTTVALVTAFTGTQADAADIDYTTASASEIEAHLADLETERDEAAEDLEGLRTELRTAQAVIDTATADYGTSDAQLAVVTAAVESAEDDLDAKVTTLVAYAQEQSDKYDEAQAAAEDADRLTADIEATRQQVESLDAEIDEAEEAYDEAAAAEAEAAAAAAAEAEAPTASSGGSSSDSSSDSTAAYSSDAATAAVEFARNQLGESYVYGSAGPDTWDCSGLVKGAYAVSGIGLTHQTNAIWDETSAIGRDDLRPGDLVFYNGLGHMALYIGDGQVIHAPKPGDVVKVADLDMGMSIDGYRRV
ncbi:NlpC/P60 family protein [Glycomyces sp. TRM65418]|uniref:C40 family peptidase n=1 Tax=Glycomyces sp. TRM65418 TaxID=2867006 RepID=UPI001CE5C1FE|nr:C40 family peptidase [Glycomyces sp. TRM65418]MCC3762428.1 NlpC/P60 family protein [Glycomyces sp. TRM65418]QZD56473.1 C40 family peptidase [Glycomyces sp. TRM65418]